MAENTVALVGQLQVGKELMKWKTAMQDALPRHITPERMARIALTSLRVNPKLQQCTFQSFIGSIITASTLGFEPFVNGQCFLVPFKDGKSGLYICTMIPGWRGYMDLVSRTGRANAWTGAVYEGDEFDYEYGSKPFIVHKPGDNTGDEKKLRYVYGVGRVNGADWPIIDVWPINRIWSHRDKNNRCYDKSDHYSFKYPEQYARKIPLLQVIKYLPSSVELNNASQLDIEGSEGRQRMTIDMGLDMAKTGALSSGQGADKELEIEALMERLSYEENKKQNLRESYLEREGGADELLVYLKKQAIPINGNSGQQTASIQQTASAQAANRQQGGEPTGSRRKRMVNQDEPPPQPEKTGPPQEEAESESEPEDEEPESEQADDKPRAKPKLLF